LRHSASFALLFVTIGLNYEESNNDIRETAATWTPSWIFDNAQGWPKSTRRILKIVHLGYPKPSRKKLTLTFPGSIPWFPDYRTAIHSHAESYVVMSTH